MWFWLVSAGWPWLFIFYAMVLVMISYGYISAPHLYTLGLQTTPAHPAKFETKVAPGPACRVVALQSGTSRVAPRPRVQRDCRARGRALGRTSSSCCSCSMLGGLFPLSRPARCPIRRTRYTISIYDRMCNKYMYTMCNIRYALSLTTGHSLWHDKAVVATYSSHDRGTPMIMALRTPVTQSSLLLLTAAHAS